MIHLYPYDESMDTPEMRTRGAVVLGHGSMMDGLSWFDTEHESLPSLLVKAGFDVYLTNDRGTRNSRRHSNLNARHDDKKYFDYSIRELRIHDAPAIINFVRKDSGGGRIIYIGYQ